MPRFQQPLIEFEHYQSLSFGLQNGGLSELTSSYKNKIHNQNYCRDIFPRRQSLVLTGTEDNDLVAKFIITYENILFHL